jgi:hypothetical protein
MLPVDGKWRALFEWLAGAFGVRSRSRELGAPFTWAIEAPGELGRSVSDVGRGRGRKRSEVYKIDKPTNKLISGVLACHTAS